MKTGTNVIALSLLEIFSKNSPPTEPLQVTKQTSPDSDRTSTEKSDAIPEIALPLRKYVQSFNEISSLSRLFRCQVLYDYTPQNPDELEIHVGDIINIIEMCDDGWFCGILEKSEHKPTMEFGTFPGNYVQLLSEEEQML